MPISGPDILLYEKMDRIVVMTINRPERMNAISQELRERLEEAWVKFRDDEDSWMCILTGAGDKVFCAGADLAFMSDISRKTDEDLQSEATRFFDCFESLYRLPIPVICYAHGTVHGGANGLLAASDFVLSTVDTRFSFSEVSLGLVPATVAPFVLRRMGSVKTRQSMISGKVMDGIEAFSGGLVDHLVSHEQADMEIEKLTGMIKENAPGAVMMTKKLLVDIEHREINGELRALTAEMIARARRSDEAVEGLDAFFSKRIPNWKTRNNGNRPDTDREQG